MNNNFEEIYNKVLSEASEELKLERKKHLKPYKTALLIGIALFVFWIIVFHSLNIMIIIISLIIASIVSRFKSTYTAVFKDKVIKTFIHAYDKNLIYKPNYGINRNIYISAEFEKYDIYSSDDYIEGTIDDKYMIKMAEVHTQDESTDSDGHRTTTTIFHGLFADIESPKIFKDTIKLRSDSGFLGKMFKAKNKLEMDSTEFEKEFDVFASDKIVTMQILTSDIMNLLLDFKNKYKTAFEITLKSNHIYIRFKTGQMFEPAMFKDSLDRQVLERYYNIINFTLDLCKLLNKTVDETEI